jgi:hypothetical protein
MSDENRLKKIVEAIKREAQFVSLKKTPAGTVTAPTDKGGGGTTKKEYGGAEAIMGGTPTPFGGGGGGGRGVSNPEVVQMQEAILNFGDVLSAHPVMSMKGGGQQEREGTKQPDFLGGTSAFGNFLVNQYVNNPEVVGGKQYVNIGMAEPLRTSTAIPSTNLAGIIKTISYVGGAGAEHKPDGDWKNRTNNALKQIYAVGKALMEFAKHMRLASNDFSDEDLEKLRSLIPESYTELKGDVGQRAAEITPYINKLTKFYKQFENTVLENPAFKPLINQEKAFVDYSKNVAQKLNEQEQAIYDANKSAVVPGVVINGKPLMLANIQDLPSFRKFLQSANVDLSRPGELQKHIDAIKYDLEGATFGAGF